MIFRVQPRRLVVVTRVVWWIPWIVATRGVGTTVVGFPSKCEWRESSVTSFQNDVFIGYLNNLNARTSCCIGLNITVFNLLLNFFFRLHFAMEILEMQEREISVCICTFRQWPVDRYVVTSLNPGIPIVCINEIQILEVVAHFVSVYLQNIVGLVF